MYPMGLEFSKAVRPGLGPAASFRARIRLRGGRNSSRRAVAVLLGVLRLASSAFWFEERLSVRFFVEGMSFSSSSRYPRA